MADETFYLFNVHTLEKSKKSWKTYKGALTNAKEYDIVSTQAGIDWIINHPELKYRQNLTT